VFGDIGTSPLYTLREAFSTHYGLSADHDTVIGLLSLVFWALTVIVTYKYVTIILHADNEGEGGIMALMALAQRTLSKGSRPMYLVGILGVFGAALFFGDGVLTPAVTVLAAIEGLEVIHPSLHPWIVPLAVLVLVTLFTPTLTTIAVAIGVVSWTGTARLARGEFLRLRRREFVLAERVIGAGNSRIIWRVILPNALAPLIVSATLAIGTAILFEAGLSFLGLGDPNVMSWGLMIGSNRPYILAAWWAVTFPGAAIFLTVLAVSLIGDGLNDALNPNTRGRT